MKRHSEISYKNRVTYMKPPTWEMIDDFINELGINRYQFERFYHIPFHTLTQVKSGTRDLPAEFWHFIYLKIKPNYGIGYLEEYNKIAQKPRVTKNVTPGADLHSRLSNVV